MLDRAVSLLRESRRALVFTGAGLSTGSGIPDFRGPQGVWKTRQPVYIQEFLASEEKRIEYWDYKLEGYETFREARPNPAHLALAELHRLGKLHMLVTQNIDGLHHTAGVPDEKLIELHGTNRRVSCLGCGRQHSPEAAFEKFRRELRCPRCACGGFLKPATISFGQALVEDDLRRAFQAAEEADLVLSLGSTLSVHPAVSVPAAAARRGAPYVIINQGPTDQDHLATVRLEGNLVEILPQLVARVSPE